MTFCTTCGGPLSESGICPTCNPGDNVQPHTNESAPQASQATHQQDDYLQQQHAPPPSQGYPPPTPQGYPPPPQGYPPPSQGYPPPPQGYPPPPQGYPQYPPQHQNYPPSYVFVQPQPSPLATDLVATLKKFFTVYPQDAVDTAANSKSHIWIIFASISVLFGALSIMLTPSGLVGGALSFIYGPLFGYGLLYSVVSFFILAGCIKLIYAVSKVDVSFVSVLNLVSSSLMFSTVFSILAILFSFFLPTASILFSLSGSLGTLALLYIGFKSAATFERSPILIFIVSYAAHSFIISTIIYLIIMSLINSSGPSYPFNYYW